MTLRSFQKECCKDKVNTIIGTDRFSRLVNWQRASGREPEREIESAFLKE